MNTNIEGQSVSPNDAKPVLPAVLLDDDGYPTEEWLQKTCVTH